MKKRERTAYRIATVSVHVTEDKAEALCFGSQDEALAVERYLDGRLPPGSFGTIPVDPNDIDSEWCIYYRRNGEGEKLYIW